jgi:hypothetical protein
MRLKFILVSLILFSLHGFGQTIQYPNPGLYGIGYNRGDFPNTLWFPTGCGAPVGKASLNSTAVNNPRRSAIYADTCGHHIYWYHANDSSWSRIDTGSGGGGSGTVTAVIISNDSLYYTTSSGNTYITQLLTPYDSTVKYATPTQLSLKMTNFGGAPGQLIGTYAGLPSAGSYLPGTTYIARDSGFQYVDTGSGLTSGWKRLGGVTSGGSPDSAIWKNSGTYTGNHTLTMGPYKQTVVGNVWNYDSLNLLVSHYQYPDTIRWVGDSYFVGYGASSPSVDMATLTCIKLQTNQRNYAVFGQLGQTGATNYIDSIPNYNPTTDRALVLNWGTNDLYQAAGGTPGIDTTHFKDSVGKFLDSIIINRHYPPQKIFYLSIINIGTAAGPNSIYHSNYFSAQKNLCAAKGIVFIDMMTPFQQIAGTPYLDGLMFDALHPNDRGHEVYSTIISSAIGYNTVAQAQAIAVNGLVEANNITARALPYANVKSTLIGVDTAGRFVQFNQMAYIPNSIDTQYAGNINLAGDATFGGEMASTALFVNGTDATLPHNGSKGLLMQYNAGTNTGNIDALNFFGAAYPIAFNSIFGGGTIMLGTSTPFDATNMLENHGKTYLNGLLQMNSTALATGTTTDSVVVETTTANVAVFKKVAQSSMSGSIYSFLPVVISSDTVGFCLTKNGVPVLGDSVIFSAITGGGLPGGSNTQIQFNNSGAFGGSPNLTWNGSLLGTTNFTASSTVKLPGVTATTTCTSCKMVVIDTSGGGGGQAYSEPITSLDTTGSSSGDSVINYAPSSGKFFLTNVSTKTYTPTVSNTTNMASNSLQWAQYTVTGTGIHVTVNGTCTATTANTVATMTVTLPISTTMASGTNVGHGMIFGASSTSYWGAGLQLASSTTVTIQFDPLSIGSSNYSVSFDYHP